ncbi:MAG TPA: GntR family transcriptional regulator [Streptosporangiaceae bacterium]|nr:GntR family transcriptional regulator [Streptosporangiaceae bacterium]
MTSPLPAGTTGPAAAAGPGQPVAALLAAAPPRFTGTLPLWYQLAQNLRTAILGLGHDGPTRLPTEVQFARHYGVSLTTVRQALGSLAADGLITRHRRRGTFVNPAAPRSRALRVLGSADAVMAQQCSDEVRVLGRARVPASAAPAARLGTSGEVVLIRRLRLDDGIPVSYAENYLRPEHAARITDAALAAAPVTRILRDDLSLPLTRIDNEVSARTVPADVSALLQIDLLSPVLVSENVTYATGSTPVDVARIHYRGDRFTFAISLDIP